MHSGFNVTLSNRLEVLYQHLKRALFASPSKPLGRRIVVVYGPAMKNWLTLKMAQDPDLQIAMGIEFVYLGEAFEHLFYLSSREKKVHFPTPLEISIAIEAELLAMIQSYPLLDSEEQVGSKQVLDLLQVNSSALDTPLSRNTEKRIIGLSEHLAGLFHDYGHYGHKMVEQWEKGDDTGWQACLWRKLFNGIKGWTYLSQALQKELHPEDFTLYFFSISFMPKSFFTFLGRLSEHLPIHYGLLSPCAVFWSDICSDREGLWLEKYWRKKLSTRSAQVQKLEELLSDRNPLLANFGRLGREMASQLESSTAQMHATYLLPDHVQELNDDQIIQADLQFTETQSPLTLLHALQTDLLLMRNLQDTPPFNFAHDDQSIQLHIAPCKRREIEILYHNLLNLIRKDPTLCPSDIIVMAPNIEEYVPFIKSIFGSGQRLLDFQIIDLGLQGNNEIAQGLLQLLDLSEGRWSAVELLQLFGHAAFQRRHQISINDYLTIQEWVAEVGIRWGENWQHRNEVLKQKHALHGMADETMVGTWDYGLNRLISSLAISDEGSSPSVVEFSDGELLGKWALLLSSLRDDLSPLQDGSRMTLLDWANYLRCLLESYFQPDDEQQTSLSEYEALKKMLEYLRAASSSFPEVQFSYLSIKVRLRSLLSQRGMTYREDYLQAVRFCSMMPLRCVPAKVLALIGMAEDAFPRVSVPSSLNLMQNSAACDYCPSPTDFDRYVFLEALHSPLDALLLSYCGFSHGESKELNPSLAVEELLSYLDRSYTIQGECVTKKCIHKHPFDAFDARYFATGSQLNNFSFEDYCAAQAAYRREALPPFQFAADLSFREGALQDTLPANSVINLRQLDSAARDPIRLHFNRALDIYLTTAEDRQLKTEEDLVVSKLDHYLIKQQAFKGSVETVIQLADEKGKLPFGLFKKLARQQIVQEIGELHRRLRKLGIDSSAVFDIEFTEGCTTPCLKNGTLWQFPPASFSLADDFRLSIVGKIPLATSEGLLSLSKGSFSDIWKAWPQYLLYCYAAKQLPGHLQPKLIFATTGKTKEPFFDDPEPELQIFARYYVRCLRSLSPLMPDLIPYFVKGDANELREQVVKIFDNATRSYQNPYFQKLFNQFQLCRAEEMIATWKDQAEELVGGLLKHWIGVKKQPEWAE